MRKYMRASAGVTLHGLVNLPENFGAPGMLSYALLILQRPVFQLTGDIPGRRFEI